MGMSTISPKNLRSKADKKSKNKRSRFSWAEVLSQDPDQIARQRAEKEFEREQMLDIPNKYKGRPTYAILEIENRLKTAKENNNETKLFYEEPDYIKGYTKTMMEIARKISANHDISAKQQQENEPDQKTATTARCRRRKSTNPTKIVKSTNNARVKQSLEEIHDNFYIRPKRKNNNADAFTQQQLTPPPSTTDESSCSSNVSSDSERVGKRNGGSNFPTKGRFNAKNGSAGTSRSSSHTSIQSMTSNKTECTTSGISSSVFFDEDADDEEDFHAKVKRQFQVQPAKKRRGRPPGKSKQKNFVFWFFSNVLALLSTAKKVEKIRIISTRG